MNKYLDTLTNYEIKNLFRKLQIKTIKNKKNITNAAQSFLKFFVI
ncbi:hypothetical protein ACW95P_03265 [Candidatus Mycoplasma pogonae]